MHPNDCLERNLMDEIKIATDTHHRSPWSVLAVLCASVFIIVVDGTIVNVALPTFMRELGATRPPFR